MEQKGKYNKKAGFCNFLFSNRTSNKVGIAISRAQSAKENDLKTEVAILKRPLSLSIKHRKMIGHLALPGVSNNLIENGIYIGYCYRSYAEKTAYQRVIF